MYLINSEDCDYVRLRQASWRDANLIWRWNNEPSVRASSINQSPISLDEHQKWFSSKLCTQGHYMWIVTYGGANVGVVRIDARSTGVAIVSIVLADSARGKGLGTDSLRAACTRFEAVGPEMPLEAWIATDNIASTRCFISCGFEWIRSELIDDRPFNVYRRKAP